MNKFLVTAIIVGVIAFLVGGGVGVFYQSQQGVPQTLQTQTSANPPVLKSLMSKVIPSIIAYGQVTDINGKNVTLAFNGDNLTVKISDSAIIYSLVSSGATIKGVAPTTTQQKVSFSVIKKGDNLNMNLKLLPDNTLEGESIIILPSVSAPK